MASTPASVASIHETLGPYVKPREQVTYIRRILALHLASYLESDQLQSPLSLTDFSPTAATRRDARGLQRDYLEALDANIRARKEYENVRQQTSSSKSSAPETRSSAIDHVEEHVSSVKLQQKQQKLLVIQKYLDQLDERAAASPGFLEPENIFKGCRRLPEVPRQVVDGFTVDTEAAKTDLVHLVGKLERVVLRTKLLLRREETALADVKSRIGTLPETVSNGTKLRALNVARTELISWIESELGKASPEEAEGSTEDEAEEGSHHLPARKAQGKGFDRDLSKDLANIREKYVHYIEARKSLVELMSQNSQPSLQAPVELAAPATLANSTSKTTAYLMGPYLEGLLAISREQKGLIMQKSHFNIALAKHLKETCQMLDHLAEESQLLPRFPVKGPSRPKHGLVDDLSAGASEKPDSSARVKPWVFAADAAKMATLEAVAEKLEDGQFALEKSTAALHEVDKLLGLNIADEGQAEEVGAKEDDIWLATAQSKKGPEARKRVEKKTDKSTKSTNDIWSVLDGKLGLNTLDRTL